MFGKKNAPSADNPVELSRTAGQAQHDGFRRRTLAVFTDGVTLFSLCFFVITAAPAAEPEAAQRRGAAPKAVAAKSATEFIVIAQPGPCVIKPVMTDEEISACRRRDPAPARDLPDRSAAPQIVAATPAPGPATVPVSCEIKPVMSNVEIDACRQR
ncbi:MAG: hypothetical protein EXR28_03835 [Betaproteobacteria bacterium]|nr:hypothetical protein [Betaproteobacteria bacterium]